MAYKATAGQTCAECRRNFEGHTIYEGGTRKARAEVCVACAVEDPKRAAQLAHLLKTVKEMRDDVVAERFEMAAEDHKWEQRAPKKTRWQGDAAKLVLSTYRVYRDERLWRAAQAGEKVADWHERVMS